jgi:hypothetical protein
MKWIASVCTGIALAFLLLWWTNDEGSGVALQSITGRDLSLEVVSWNRESERSRKPRIHLDRLFQWPSLL